MMNSYGKTWHVWNTGIPDRSGDQLPLGAPQLAWSFSADGEIPQAMLEARKERLGVDAVDKRKQRADLTKEAHPQEGVDALASAFPKRPSLPGVVEQGAGKP